jgi:hypothetical protein
MGQNWDLNEYLHNTVSGAVLFKTRIKELIRDGNIEVVKKHICELRRKMLAHEEIARATRELLDDAIAALPLKERAEFGETGPVAVSIQS